MKNLFLMLLVAVVVIGCKDNEDTKPKSEPLNSLEVAKTPPTCSNYIIYIKRTSVNQSWINANAQHICANNPSDSFIKIDLTTFNTPKILADSLKSYGNKIDYDSSSNTIEKMHKKLLTVTEIQNLTFSKDTYTWAILQNKINVSNNDYYKKYINIKIDSNDKVVFTEVANHYDNGTTNNFSIPLFKAIVKNHNIKPNDVFHFAKDNSGEIVFKIVTTSGEVKGYFDISKDPLFVEIEPRDF